MCPDDTCIHWGGRDNSDCHLTSAGHLFRGSCWQYVTRCTGGSVRLWRLPGLPWGRTWKGTPASLGCVCFLPRLEPFQDFIGEAVYMQPMDRHFWWHPSDQAASFHLLMGKSLHLHDANRLQSSGLSQRGVAIVYLMGSGACSWGEQLCKGVGKMAEE